MKKKIIVRVIVFLIIIGGVGGYYIWGQSGGYDYHYVEAVGMEKVTLQYKQIEDVAPNLLSLDVYTDPAFTDKPVIFYVHGGGLKNGDKTNYAAYLAKSNYFVSRGYVYISINYRLSPEVVSPAHIADVADAFMFIYNNISRYGGDNHQIYIMGHSAGAYLVSLLATNEEYIENAGGSLLLIKGVISLDTWTYMSVQSWQESELSKDPLERFEAIPANHVSAGKGIPPFLIFYRDGRKDAAVQADQLGFIDLIDDNQIAAAAILCEDDSHLLVNQEIGTIGDQKTEIIMEFLVNPNNTLSIAEDYGFIAYNGRIEGTERSINRKLTLYLVPTVIIIAGIGTYICIRRSEHNKQKNKSKTSLERN